MKRYLLVLCLALPCLMMAQKDMLKAGPMQGYSEMKEAAIWLQTTESADVYAQYWNVEKPSESKKTTTVKTNFEEAYTAMLIATNLEPGQIYQYDLYINNKKVDLGFPTYFHTPKIWRWRGDPPDFSFLMGSCAYINETRYDRPGTPYGNGYEIYDNMATKKADFMLWLGDNLYFREPDWNSWSGIVQRYTHDRGIPELQKFLTSTQHYAIWDDHDYGPNDSDRSFWNKNKTLDAFELFWANPSYGVGDIEGAITFFQWSDADFYLLDNRTYRSPDNLISEDKTQLGEEQLQWLFDNLVTNPATFKFVVIGGQFLSTSGVFESYTNFGFEKERQQIIDFIYKQDIKNVIFLTGDVHFSEISVLKNGDKPAIWDITSSPLNSGVNTNGINQKNTLRIPESVIMERNFTQLTISGPEKERVIEIIYFDVKGTELFRYSISAEYPPEKK